MNNRIERVNEQLKRVLSDALLTKLNDKAFLSFITITQVKASADLGNAKVFVSVMGQSERESKEILNKLQKASGFLKNCIAESLELRVVPKLTFILDEGALYSTHINEILKKLNIPAEEKNED